MKKESITKNKIIAMLRKEKDIFRKYNVKKMGIFGSFVRGEQKKNSDIDVLVEFNIATFDNYMGLRSDLTKELGHKIDLISVKALKERIKPYILKEVIWL